MTDYSYQLTKLRTHPWWTRYLSRQKTLKNSVGPFVHNRGKRSKFTTPSLSNSRRGF